MKTTFPYGTIELMPYPDLGEFVIVGVLLVERERYVRARVIDSKRTKRITQFFPEIERKVFTSTLARLRDEVARWECMMNGEFGGGIPQLFRDEKEANGMMSLLTSPREGMVRIRRRGVAMADDASEWLEEAFRRFVTREEAEPVNPVEQRFTKQVKDHLVRWRLDRFYRETIVGEEHYHAKFPFAYTPEGSERPFRAIKPLHLGHENPTAIIEHGDQWLQKIRRLRQFNQAPEQVVFPVRLPNGGGRIASERVEAVRVVMDDFRREEIIAIPENQTDQLREAVAIAPDFSGGLFS